MGKAESHDKRGSSLFWNRRVYNQRNVKTKKLYISIEGWEQTDDKEKNI